MDTSHYNQLKNISKPYQSRFAVISYIDDYVPKQIMFNVSEHLERITAWEFYDTLIADGNVHTVTFQIVRLKEKLVDNMR